MKQKKPQRERALRRLAEKNKFKKAEKDWAKYRKENYV